MQIIALWIPDQFLLKYKFIADKKKILECVPKLVWLARQVFLKQHLVQFVDFFWTRNTLLAFYPGLAPGKCISLRMRDLRKNINYCNITSWPIPFKYKFIADKKTIGVCLVWFAWQVSFQKGFRNLLSRWKCTVSVKVGKYCQSGNVLSKTKKLLQRVYL